MSETGVENSEAVTASTANQTAVEKEATNPPKPAWKKLDSQPVETVSEWPALQDAKQPLKKKDKINETTNNIVSETRKEKDTSSGGGHRGRNKGQKLPISVLNESGNGKRGGNASNSGNNNDSEEGGKTEKGHSSGSNKGHGRQARQPNSSNRRNEENGNANNTSGNNSNSSNKGDHNQPGNQKGQSRFANGNGGGRGGNGRGSNRNSNRNGNTSNNNNNNSTPAATVASVSGGANNNTNGVSAVSVAGSTSSSTVGIVPTTMSPPSSTMAPYLAAAFTNAVANGGSNTSFIPPYIISSNGTTYFPASFTKMALPVTRDDIMQKIREQINYYFTPNNLCKDLFLRSKMDNEGWVPLAVVSSFNRVRVLTHDQLTIVEALRKSDVVELSSDFSLLRCRDNWRRWTLTNVQQDLSHSPAKREPESKGRLSANSKSYMATTKVAEVAKAASSDVVVEAQEVPKKEEDKVVDVEVVTPIAAPVAAVAAAAGASISVAVSPVKAEASTFAVDEHEVPARTSSFTFSTVPTPISVAAPSSCSSIPAASPGPKKEEDDEDDDLFAMDEDDTQKEEEDDDKKAKEANEVPRLSDRDLDKLVIVTSSRRTGRRSVNTNEDKEIADGLALYEKELADNVKARVQGRPPRSAAPEQVRSGAHANAIGPRAGFYGSSLSKSMTAGNRFSKKIANANFPMESPPSNAVGWLMAATPPEGSCMLLGSSPGSSFAGSYTNSYTRRSFLGASSPRVLAQGMAGSAISSSVISSAAPVSGSVAGSAPISKFQHPSYALLVDKGFKQIKYIKWLKRCLEDRAAKGVGQSEEMNMLFRFWSYFLREHFNERMYRDLRKYADEDSVANYHYGTECLFRFFSYGLEKKFNEELYKDFEEATIKNYEISNSLYGLEKFWAFHHYSGIPKSAGVKVNPKLKALLDGPFHTIDDFRNEKAKRNNNNNNSSSSIVSTTAIASSPSTVSAMAPTAVTTA
mmetsp:Transcript_2566/g.3884  ORF Transcript_2566/g.3884 Transcript_2566/m.3884 type:complete len:973 (-) Transcript_2566:116-3034(-)|eukprot:CAMPEP_0175042544 /NCGR_PEP_ID=MMETSP0052_2-20121109/2634_1 /TAXON_ID=51329 ORGANISM="Polytomella parva, Strain SAG 63-3" /NCGR_SAMPLE_ID=MMETSP0052_2 /ASSEMBLY_ACC=CAM_ASM_000194 /LENGTH=972 /DNA_ID=CAMNT_0016305391 /DNA_START=89 /DNA_END=3007 /DNA_ORIENTATION=+